MCVFSFLSGPNNTVKAMARHLDRSYLDQGRSKFEWCLYLFLSKSLLFLKFIIENGDIYASVYPG